MDLCPDQIEYKSLKIVYKFAAYLAIVPKNYNNSKWRTVFPVFMVLIFTIVPIVSIWKNASNVHLDLSVVLESASFQFLIIFLNLSIVNLTVLKSETFYSFLKILFSTPTFQNNFYRRFKIVVFLLILIHTAFIGTSVTLGCLFATSLIDFKRFFDNVVVVFSCYSIFINIFLFNNFIHLLQFKFKFVNEYLKKISRTTTPYSNRGIGVLKIGDASSIVCELRSNYDVLGKAVANVNSFFGFQIVTLGLSMCFQLLGCMDTVIRLTLGFNVYQPPQNIIFHLFWCFSLWVIGVVIAVTCGMTTTEAQKTATICYDLLLDVPALSLNLHDRTLRRELILLALQATHQCPYFSAAGFFNVDYTMLFRLFGTVTSYFILLIQINRA